MTDRMTAAEYQATAKRRNPRKRHTPGRMNKLEARFAAYLDMLKAAGIVESWRFEPEPLVILPKSGPKRRRITWKPDFLVEVKYGSGREWEALTGGRMVVFAYIDVKGGHWEEDALLKIRIAACLYSDLKNRFGAYLGDFYAVKAKGDGWEWERFGGGNG